MMLSFRRMVAATLLVSVSLVAFAFGAGDPPKKGDEAKDFKLVSLAGEPVSLSKHNAGRPVVLVVLRGYPGYQCPLCTEQYGEFLAAADEFKKVGATVLFIYPGPADKLKQHAGEFVKGKDYPAHFQILLDPDYSFTNAYNLRWDAKGETAYPSTFVLDGKRLVKFAKVSKGHGGRASVAEVLKALAS